MAWDFQQTDNPSGCTPAAFCSGASLNTDTSANWQATNGGTPGVSEIVTSIDDPAADLAAIWFECIVGGAITWSGGTWTVRINLTTGNPKTTLDAIHICRVNSSCVNQASIGSATGLALSMSTPGVISQTVTGAAQSPSGGDKVMIVCLLDNPGPGARNAGITPSELITSPFTPPAGGQVFMPVVMGGM